MPFSFFMIIWCCLIVAVIVTVRKIYGHMVTMGHKITFPLAPPELFRFIAYCTQTQKETGDKKLRNLIVLLNTIYAVAVTIMLLMAFGYIQFC